MMNSDDRSSKTYPVTANATYRPSTPAGDRLSACQFEIVGGKLRGDRLKVEGLKVVRHELSGDLGNTVSCSAYLLVMGSCGFRGLKCGLVGS